MQDCILAVLVCYRFVDFLRDHNRIGETSKNYVAAPSVLSSWSRNQPEHNSKSWATKSKRWALNLIITVERWWLKHRLKIYFHCEILTISNWSLLKPKRRNIKLVQISSWIRVMSQRSLLRTYITMSCGRNSSSPTRCKIAYNWSSFIHNIILLVIQSFKFQRIFDNTFKK